MKYYHQQQMKRTRVILYILFIAFAITSIVVLERFKYNYIIKQYKDENCSRLTDVEIICKEET